MKAGIAPLGNDSCFFVVILFVSDQLAANSFEVLPTVKV